MVTVITGGIKSGKSSYALKLGERFDKKLYIATAEPFDEEMKKKIALHRKERVNGWDTIEEPINLIHAIEKGVNYDFILIDCITMWINNLIYYEKDAEKYADELLDFLKVFNTKNIVFVTNEVGLGIVPMDEISRRYVNLLGITNQKIALVATNLILMVSGYPLYIKSLQRHL